jgi:hypothetical protein
MTMARQIELQEKDEIVTSSLGNQQGGTIRHTEMVPIQAPKRQFIDDATFNALAKRLLEENMPLWEDLANL